MADFFFMIGVLFRDDKVSIWTLFSWRAGRGGKVLSGRSDVPRGFEDGCRAWLTSSPTATVSSLAILSREWVRAHMTSPASLQGRGLQRDHDSRFHFLNEWDCVVHQFLPAVFMPGSIPYVFPGLKVLVSPEVMHHI